MNNVFKQKKQSSIDRFKKPGGGSPPGADLQKPGGFQLKEELRTAEGATPLRTFQGYDVEGTLKDFDLNMKFGPCLGLSRLDRWNRAESMGLNPPPLVKQILEEAAGLPHCLWEGRV